MCEPNESNVYEGCFVKTINQTGWWVVRQTFGNVLKVAHLDDITYVHKDNVIDIRPLPKFTVKKSNIHQPYWSNMCYDYSTEVKHNNVDFFMLKKTS